MVTTAMLVTGLLLSRTERKNRQLHMGSARLLYVLKRFCTLDGKELASQFESIIKCSDDFLL